MKRTLCLCLCLVMLALLLTGCFRIRSGPYFSTQEEAYLANPTESGGVYGNEKKVYDTIRTEIEFIEITEKYGIWLATVDADSIGDGLLVCGMDIKKRQYRTALDRPVYHIETLIHPLDTREEIEKGGIREFYITSKQRVSVLIGPYDWFSAEERAAGADNAVFFVDIDIPYENDTAKITIRYAIVNV